MRKSTLLLLALIMVSTSFSQDAEAKRRHRRARAKKLKVINEKKLYERIGNSKGVSEIVDEWLRLDLADSRISAVLVKTAAEPSRLAKMRKEMNDRLCELSDGPCKARSQELKILENDKNVSDDQFLALSENLFKSLEKHGTPEREKNELLARVGEWRDETTQDSDSPSANTDPAPAAVSSPKTEDSSETASHMTSSPVLESDSVIQHDSTISDVLEQR